MKRAAILLALAACSAPPAPPPVAPPPPPSASAVPEAKRWVASSGKEVTGPHDERATALEAGGVELWVQREVRTSDPHLTHAPPGDRSITAVATTAVVFLADGTLVAGARDGTVTALDAQLGKLWSFGLPGEITGLAAIEDRVVVTGASGTVAFADRQGRVLWEKLVAPGPLEPPAIDDAGALVVTAPIGSFVISQAGEVLFSRAGVPREDKAAAAAPRPPVPDAAPTFPLRFTLERDQWAKRILVVKPDEVWTLVEEPVHRGPRWPVKTVVERFDGKRWSRVPIRADKDLFLENLALAPDGRVLLLGRVIDRKRSNEYADIGSAYVAAWDGARFRAAKEIDAAFEEFFSANPLPPYLGGRLRLACFTNAGPGYDSACAEHDGAGFRKLDPPEGNLTVGAVVATGATSWIVDSDRALRRDGGAWRDLKLPDSGALAGTGPDDLWVAGSIWHRIHHFDGRTWTAHAIPAPAGDAIHAVARDDVWAGGDDLLHFDGQRWSRVLGLRGSIRSITGTRDDLWVATGEGVWRGRPWPREAPVTTLPAARSPETAPLPPPAPLPLGAREEGYRVERLAFDVPGGARLTGAIDVDTHSDSTWLAAYDRVVEVDLLRGRAKLVRKGHFSDCRRCADAMRGRLLDGGWSYSRPALDPGWHRDELQLDAPVARAPTFTVGNHADPTRPRAVALGDGGWRYLLGLPAAHWADVASEGDTAFLAGGLSTSNDGARTWPVGEGVLVHVERDRVTRFRAPAALLAVTKTSRTEAWSVGAAGLVVHLQANALSRFTLPSGEWLRAVLVDREGAVWIGGDGGTLLRFDGRAFHAVPGLGDVSLTGLAEDARGAILAVGPAAILKLTRR